MKDRNTVNAVIALVVLIVLAIIVTIIANRQKPPVEETITPQTETPVSVVTELPQPTDVPIPFFTQTLTYGMESSEQVAGMQSVLIALGLLTGTPNGEFFTYTQDALKKFQEAKNLPVTGRVDEDTQKALNTLVPTLPTGSSMLSCPGIAVLVPAAHATVTFPLSVSGIIHPIGNTGPWSVFEGQAGSVSVISLSGSELIAPIPIILSVDWMNTNPKPFTISVPSLSSNPSEPTVFLKFQDDNAADLPEGVPHYCFVPVTVTN